MNKGHDKLLEKAMNIGMVTVLDLLIDRLNHIKSLGNVDVSIDEMVEYINLLIAEDEDVKLCYQEYLKIK